MCIVEFVVMLDGFLGLFYLYDLVGYYNIYLWMIILVKMKVYIFFVGNWRFWLVNLCYMILNRMKIRLFYIFLIYVLF